MNDQEGWDEELDVLHTIQNFCRSKKQVRSIALHRIVKH